MHPHSLKKQAGVVLVFSMAMLLLVGLVSIHMLQENTVQIKMTSNSAMQNQTLSNVESALTGAETALQTLRFTTNGNKVCKATNQLSEGDVITGTNAQITAVYCAYNNNEYRCINPNYTAYNTNDANNIEACRKLKIAQCPTEIYKFNIAIADSATGSTRAIKEKFGIGCIANINS